MLELEKERRAWEQTQEKERRDWQLAQEAEGRAHSERLEETNRAFLAQLEDQRRQWQATSEERDWRITKFLIALAAIEVVGTLAAVGTALFFANGA